MTILTQKQHEQLLANSQELSFLALRYSDINDVKELVDLLNRSDNTYIHGISFDESDLTDELLDVLSGLTTNRISQLHLSGPESKITDAGITCLNRLGSSLKHLEISGDLSPKCLDVLFKLPSLKVLEITSGNLRDENIRSHLLQREDVEVYLNGADAPVRASQPTFSLGRSSPTLFSASSPLSQQIDERDAQLVLLEHILDMLSSMRQQHQLDAVAKKIDPQVLQSFDSIVSAAGTSTEYKYQ